MKKTIIIAAALVAMTACNKTLIESPVTEDSNYGYINLGISADTEMVIDTKTGDNTGENTQVNTDDFVVTLSQNSTIIWAKVKNQIQDSDLKLAAGTYTLTAENNATIGTDGKTVTDVTYSLTDTKGSKKINGKCDVTVTAGEPVTASISCSVVNSKISFACSSDFREHFKKYSVTVEETITSNPRKVENMTVGDNHSDDNAAYFEVGTLKCTLTATADVDNKVKTYTKEVTTKTKSWSKLTFSTSVTDGQITLNVTASDDMQELTEETEGVDPFGGTEQNQ